MGCAVTDFTALDELKDDISMADDVFIKDIEKNLSFSAEKRKRLTEMEIFILDNSLRETTVAALRAHTVANKRAIYEEVKKAGIKYFIIESFSHETRIGDMFLKVLLDENEDLSNAFAFADLWEKAVDKVPQPDISIGLIKCKRFGIRNVILEMDLMYYKIDYDTFNMRRLCYYLKDKIDWIRANISNDAMIITNIRDFSNCMLHFPERVRYVVNFLAMLPVDERVTGIAYEDMGRTRMEHMAAWTKAVRNEMERCGWWDGEFLVHIHEQWGMANAINMECLAAGATGMWAALCGEGAGIGHVDSTTAIISLLTLGNTKVQQQYNCKYLREAAINITKIVTEHPPDPKQPVYGERALDMLFGGDFANLIAGRDVCVGFDMFEFFGLKRDIRITTMASGEMIAFKLKNVFGDDEQFTVELGDKMRSMILLNAAAGRKEECNSDVGLAMLFDQAGGHMTEAMLETLENEKGSATHIQMLINQVKQEWDLWDGRDGQKDDELSFFDFYNGFMARYFGCYRCEDSQKGLQALDMDNDGMIDWNEFRFYLIWAGRQYPHIKTSKELLDTAFRKGLIPALRDEMLKMNQ